MRTQNIYNTRDGKHVAMYITGDYATCGVSAMNDVIDNFGGIEAAFHEIKRMQGRNLLPRSGSVSRPLTVRDIRYAGDNEQRGERYWRWGTYRSARSELQGYGYLEGGRFHFVNADDSVHKTVPSAAMGRVQ